MRKAGKWIRNLILGLGVFAVAFPLLWCVLLSFKSNGEIMSAEAPFLPTKLVLDGYRRVLEDAPFFQWLFNSIVTAVAATALTAFTSCVAGYIFAKFRFRGKTVLFFAILATMMVPFQVTMIPLYLIVNKMQMLDSLLALIVPYMVSGFGVFLCRQFAESIPTEIIESGRIEGAGEWRIFFRLIMPMMKSGISALCIFTFMGRWNDYVWPLIALTSERKMTLPLALNYFNSNLFTDYNASMSAGVLVMLPLLIIYFIFQKQFVESITLTGIK